MSWHHNDLTVAASAPLPGAVSGLSAYAFEHQGTQHVIYFGQESHINELWWDNNGWHHNDLTVAASAPLPGIDPGTSAYAFEHQGTQHVIYYGQEFHINELWWENNGWHHNDLTAASGGPLPSFGLSAYAFEDQGTQHVIYVGQNDVHIDELWLDNKGWHHNDLTVATDAPLAAVDSNPSAYTFEDQGTQHVIYVGGRDLHINELWWDSNGWHHNDLTAATGAPLPSVDSNTSAYAFEDQGTQHVIYVGQDFHINELWWDSNGWHHNDLTAATGAPLPAVDSITSAYAFEDQGTQHVIYVGQDNHINELWWAPD